jgi:hypothetical protein
MTLIDNVWSLQNASHRYGALLLMRVALISLYVGLATANPKSKPYIPFVTDPLDQTDVVHHVISIPEDHHTSIPHRPDTSNLAAEKQCPLHFTLGVSRRNHHSPDAKSMSIIEPPSIYPVFPSHGPGRQVIHTTQYEHLDLLVPSEVTDQSSVKEGITQHQDFPLLFESSSFLGQPIIHDANGDGIVDAILADYDGGVYFIGLKGNKDGRRYFYKFQVPRLFVRRDWMEQRMNETIRSKALKDEKSDDSTNYHANDPYHSYFEYGSSSNDRDVLRGVKADVMSQDHAIVNGLEDRRSRKVNHQRSLDLDDSESGTEDVAKENSHDIVDHRRRLQEVESHHSLDHESFDGEVHDRSMTHDVQHNLENGDGHGHNEIGHMDDTMPYDQNGESNSWPDDDNPESESVDGAKQLEGEHDRYPGYDDYHDSRYHYKHNDYYDEKHYIRLPPHILASPALADMKKSYSESGEREEMIFIAVSYYFDEDEYEGHFSYKRFENTDRGDETEQARGKFVASALVSFVFDGENPRSSREEHLDLSGDESSPPDVTILPHIQQDKRNTNLGAFALSTPTIADIDGNGEEEVIMGTSMGMIYCFHARYMQKLEGWPIQLPNSIQSRILVEDVTGSTNLELFVLDSKANVYCIDSSGEILWRRDLLNSIAPRADIRGLSAMTMGDIDGDGTLDIVLTMKVMSVRGEWISMVISISAVTGNDIDNFPIEFDSPLLADDGSGTSELLQKLPQALLIDLHADQDHWASYISRNGTKWDISKAHDSTRKKGKAKKSVAHGGSATGLHVVQPIGSRLAIIEAGSGCTHLIDIGEEINAMVQADDIHGTGNIDLLISTAAGNIVTLEAPSVPYHPLNVWNTGEVRGRRNSFAHGFSASQGVFVHERSRRYRDIYGVYLPITFQIFDNRPNIANEPNKREYQIEIRDGTSSKRSIFRKTYNSTGVFSENLYISYGPGFYTITILLRTSHGLVYEDSFHVGYNVHYMDGFGILLWLPLMLAAFVILVWSRPKPSWDDDEYDENARGPNQGILGS